MTISQQTIFTEAHPCKHCGANDHLLHDADCPNYGLWTAEGYPIPDKPNSEELGIGYVGLKNMKWGNLPKPNGKPSFHYVVQGDGEIIGSLQDGEVRTTSSTGAEKGMKPQRYDLIPIGPMAKVAELYGNGAKKYDSHNWRKGYEWSKSYAAMQRHATQFWAGEDIDPEMQLPHLASVVFHALAMMEFMETHPEFDDRYKPEVKEDTFDIRRVAWNTPIEEGDDEQ